MSYAEGTRVPVNQSQNEIRALLTKHGATRFAFGDWAEPQVEAMYEHGQMPTLLGAGS